MSSIADRATNVIHRRLIELWLEAKDAVQEARGDRPSAPEWREADDMAAGDWRHHASNLADYADVLESLLSDLKSDFLKAQVHYGTVSIGQTPSEAVKAYEEDGYPNRDFTVDDLDITVEETPDREFDFGAKWTSPEGAFKDGCVFEVPGGFVLTHLG